MASTSSSASLLTHSFKRDVFLSFGGEDTRYSFISHLHSALSRKSIRTFIDDKLRRGEEISQGLLNAIEESVFAVVVFSEGYASSRWCLDELAKIVECIDTRGQKVIPVFYHVDPSDVRKQTGTFAEALDRHEANFNSNTERLQRWRAALTKAAELSGWDTKNCRMESDIVDGIVRDIWKDLQKMRPSPLKGLVGIDPLIEQLQALLFSRSSSSVFILGLWGMGGIGKTTIANALFGHINCQFERRCFLENVREKSEKRGLEKLGKRLLSDLLEEEKIKTINMSDIGKFFCMLRGIKVLLVLDDVNDGKQLEYLAGDRGRYTPGSRIIITSRDRQLINPFVDEVHEVKALLHPDNLQLFSLHAFEHNVPTDDLRELSSLVVCYAKGVPLALKVLGSSLLDKSKTEWESTLKKLENSPNKEIQDVLRISFSSLDREEKELFLWIACCLKDRRKDLVMELLNDCGFSTEIGLSVLVDKSLITLSKYRNDEGGIVYEEIKMHDLLQEMGREIVREESEDPGERRWLWNDEDIHKVFRQNSGTKKIKGIRLETSNMKEVQLHPDTFARMGNLKFLKINVVDSIYKVRLPKGINAFPDELRYLSWHGYPWKSLPANFNLENLIELRLFNSKITELFCDEMPVLAKLKIIDLRSCEQLCKISNLSRAPNVTEIDLAYCPKLRSLPDLSDLKSLKKLYLDFCSNLETFPKVPRNTEILRLSGTAIKEVPSASVEYLDNLVHLNMSGCSQLESLPSNVDLKSLVTLNFSGCSALRKFPEISENLQSLYLSGTAVKEVPSTIWKLHFLQRLRLNRCSNLTEFPASIKQLSLLECLVIAGCKSLQSIPELPQNLLRLNASGCPSLETISGAFTRLAFWPTDSWEICFFNFAGCLKLDEKECGDMVCDLRTNFITNGHRYKVSPSQLHRYKTPRGFRDPRAILRVSITYMGSKIPEWISRQSVGDSISYEFPANRLNDGLLGFALGFIYDPCGNAGCIFPFFGCECYIGDKRLSRFSLTGPWGPYPVIYGTETEHVFVTFDRELRDVILRNARKSQFCHDVFLLKFRCDSAKKSQCSCKIKMCGAIPLYD